MFNVYDSAVNFDGPLEHGPVPRWQRKQEVNSLNTSRSMTSLNTSESFTSTTPKKTPGKTPRHAHKTPEPGDRFIPKRSGMDFEKGHFKLLHESSTKDEIDPDSDQAILKENLANDSVGDTGSEKILRFKPGVPVNAIAQANYNKIVYSSNKSSAKKTGRPIPRVPERVLDAPDYIDDYYLNLLHWGPSQVAVALGQCVYLWDPATGGINQLCQVESDNVYISSVKWLMEGNSYVAIGTSEGHVQLWDVGAMKMLRVMAGHEGRVGSMSWNSYILSSGSRTGSIHQHDVRAPNHHVSSYDAHMQEVCGLEWCGDGQTLASGANDNLLCLWDIRHTESATPLFQLTDHVAAVKAVKWCPWQRHVLATGGGTSDRTIKIWNASTGVCLSSTDTKSQVCGIEWSVHFKELISGHGYAQNQITMWKYPAMKQIVDLLGHSSRVLALTISPDNSFVMSASADETLRLWRMAVLDQKKSKTAKKAIEKGNDLANKLYLLR